MAKVPYVKYEDMDEFYTIQDVCRLFQMNKSQLKEKCAHYEVYPTRNEIGQFGFHKYDVCKLHNLLYYEDRRKGSRPAEDPWA